jgi:hypothetical protein
METKKLKTVNNFSREYGYSNVYIYRLIKNGVIKEIVIDGVKFIDMESIPADFKKKD